MLLFLGLVGSTAFTTGLFKSPWPPFPKGEILYSTKRQSELYFIQISSSYYESKARSMNREYVWLVQWHLQPAYSNPSGHLFQRGKYYIVQKSNPSYIIFKSLHHTTTQKLVDESRMPVWAYKSKGHGVPCPYIQVLSFKFLLHTTTQKLVV